MRASTCGFDTVVQQFVGLAPSAASWAHLTQDWDWVTQVPARAPIACTRGTAWLLQHLTTRMQHASCMLE